MTPVTIDEYNAAFHFLYGSDYQRKLSNLLCIQYHRQFIQKNNGDDIIWRTMLYLKEIFQKEFYYHGNSYHTSKKHNEKYYRFI